MNRKIVLVGTALLLAVGVGVAWWWFERVNGQALRLPGVVEIQEVRLGSKVGGRVADVLVREGDVVEPGQPLVTFDVPELQAQLEQAQARLQQAQADLEKARNGPRHEEKEAARAAVEAAQARWQRLKTGWREEEIRQAKNELESAESDLKLAREDFDRVDRLYRQGSVARAEYDAARAARDRAQAQAAAARARYDMYARGSRPEDIAEAAAELARARAQLDLLLAGTRSEDIAIAAAQVAEAAGRVNELKANLQEATVTAPEKAVVEIVAVRKGDLVPPHQPVVRVLRADDLWVKIYVPETELGKLRLNQAVEVTIDSYPGRRFPGTIMHIAAESEFTPRNVQSVDERRHQVFGVRVRVPQPEDPAERIFKSGMAAEVYVPLYE